MESINSLFNLSQKSDTKSPGLNQGVKFKTYQNRFINGTNSEKKYGNVKEGFEGGPGSAPANDIVYDTSVNANAAADNGSQEEIPPENILTIQSNEIIENNDYAAKQDAIDKLREQYQDALVEFTDLTASISGSVNNYLNRINNNPYLGKNIRFTSGHICYVTQQGVVKYIPTPEIWKSIQDKNGCPGSAYTDVTIPWISDYDTPETYIEQLNLITGTPMESAQSCGNAGKNVFVNQLVSKPGSTYMGCYNDKPPATEIMFVPTMNSSNNVSGYKTYASSVYQNNNTWGPWAAFDGNSGTFWHSAVGSAFNYNNKTGVYGGSNVIITTLKNGSSSSIKGEYLQINLPESKALTRYDIQGRQGCCGNPSGRSPNSWTIVGWDGSKWNEVDKRENQGLNFEMRTYFISLPKLYSAYVMIVTNCGNPGNQNERYCVQIAQWKLYTSTDYTPMTDDKRSMIWKQAEIGYTDLETCQKYAVENGYQYFGMQDGKPDGTAACLVSNDLASSKKYGTAYSYKAIALWDSKTGGGTGNTALVNIQGSLVVQNSGGAAIFATPAYKAASSYVGCLGDRSSRAMPLLNGGSQSYNYQSCEAEAIKQNKSYFGLQNSTTGQNAQCVLSDSISSSSKYGVAKNCTKLNDGTYSGGGWSNAVYINASKITQSYFLYLHDSGDMCLYRGSSPSNNQGLIWKSNTYGKQKQRNPNFSSEKSKYGSNWIASGTPLAAGDFIASTNGYIYLIMQSDGNLVLYTSENSSACSTNSKGQQVGGSWVNALYKLLPSGIKENIGKLGYVDSENVLHEYPSDNVKLSTKYTRITKMDTYGNDLPGASYGNATIDQCYSSCNNRGDCYGFVFDNQNKVCYPKSSGAYPYGGPLRLLSHTDIYVRGKQPITPPIGVPIDVANVDSLQYQYYTDGGKLDSKYGLSRATEDQEKELDRLQKVMQGLTQQIATLTEEQKSGVRDAQLQSEQNLNGINDYRTELQENENQSNAIMGASKSGQNIESFLVNNNIDKIVQESDIDVLQKNYEYLLWSILAAGSVIVAMNITKSES